MRVTVLLKPSEGVAGQCQSTVSIDADGAEGAETLKHRPIRAWSHDGRVEACESVGFVLERLHPQAGALEKILGFRHPDFTVKRPGRTSPSTASAARSEERAELFRSLLIHAREGLPVGDDRTVLVGTADANARSE